MPNIRKEKERKMIKKLLLNILYSVGILQAQSVTITYSYDALDRMTAVSYSSGGDLTYSFDDAGNLLAASHSDAPGAELTLTPRSLDFGEQAVGSTSTARRISVENTGNVEIDRLSIRIDSDEYRLDHNCPERLSINEECRVFVYFEPVSTGNKLATVIIDSSGTATRRVDLNGTATERDTDGDGIPDSDDTDEDNDGISDADEERYGLDPLDPNDADEDADGDGYSNRVEIEAGSDPNDPDDVPKRFVPIIYDGLIIIVPR